MPPAVVHNALKPGGWLLFGRFAGPQEPLADAVTRLRVLRSGGSVADAEQLGALMREAGLADVHEVPRTWQTPVGFVASSAALTPPRILDDCQALPRADDG